MSNLERMNKSKSASAIDLGGVTEKGWDCDPRCTLLTTEELLPAACSPSRGVSEFYLNRLALEDPPASSASSMSLSQRPLPPPSQEMAQSQSHECGREGEGRAGTLVAAAPAALGDGARASPSPRGGCQGGAGQHCRRPRPALGDLGVREAELARHGMGPKANLQESCPCPPSDIWSFVFSLSSWVKGPKPNSTAILRT